MEPRAYLDELLCGYEALYDVERDHAFNGYVFPAYAAYHAEASQYVLSKKAKLWSAKTHEHIFFWIEDELDEARTEKLLEFMTHEALTKIKLDPEHMTTYLTLVIITQKVNEETCALIKKKRFRKNFMAGLRGWTDLRLAVADLSSCRIITNKQGEEIAASLERCFEKGKRHP